MKRPVTAEQTTEHLACVCGETKTEVIDSRPQLKYLRRRRVCPYCKLRFSTVEIKKDFFDEMQDKIKGQAKLIENFTQTIGFLTQPK